MDIAIVSTPCVKVPPDGYGGTELVVGVLVEELAARGHRVTLFAPGDSRVPARIRGAYATAAWPPDPWRELAHARVAAREIAAGGFDVVHAHIPAMCAFAAELPVPMVNTVHHAPYAPLTELYGACWPAPLTHVALTEAHARTLGRELWPGRAPVVLGHGLPPSRFPLGTGGARAAFLGRWAPEKGPHVAIDVARRAQVPLALAGRVHEADRAWWSKAGAPLVGQRGVETVGELGHDAKVRLLGGSCALLFPIAWEEPFGLVIIESMLCGTPVVAFRRGSVPELVDEGVTGFVVDEEEEMVARLRDLARGGFDRGACRARAVRRFGAARMADRYLRLYRDVITATTPHLELTP